MGKELDTSTSNLWRIPYPAVATPDGLHNLLLATAPSPDHTTTPAAAPPGAGHRTEPSPSSCTAQSQATCCPGQNLLILLQTCIFEHCNTVQYNLFSPEVLRQYTGNTKSCQRNITLEFDRRGSEHLGKETDPEHHQLKVKTKHCPV